MALRLIPVESGWLDTQTATLCEGGSGDISIPVCTWLVDHPKGTVLFDTGMHGDLVSSSDRIGSLAELFGIRMRHPLNAALAEREIDATRIDYVVFSHLHFDHSGGTHAIPNARLIVQADEWAAGHDAAMITGGVYSPADFDIGHDVIQVRGAYDVFGDDTVVCIPTPGHTAGHQSLRVNLESGPVLLVADCCYWSDMLEQSLTPPFAHDREQQLRSMQRLRDMQIEGVRLMFGHDKDQWQQIFGRVLE